MAAGCDYLFGCSQKQRRLIEQLRERSEKGALTWVAVTGPIIYTVVFAGVWWLKEVYAVGKLKRARAVLMAGISDADNLSE